VDLDDGVTIPLSAVANVERGVGTKRGDAGINAHPGVILSIQKQPGASTIDLTEEVTHAIEEIKAGVPRGVEVITLCATAMVPDRGLCLARERTQIDCFREHL